MYESEADEKHLDFIAGNPAMVSIGVSRLFCFPILVLCNCPVHELSLPYPIWGLNPEGEGSVWSFHFTQKFEKGHDCIVAYDGLPILHVASCSGKLEESSCMKRSSDYFHFVSVCHLDRRFSNATQQRGKVVNLRTPVKKFISSAGSKNVTDETLASRFSYTFILGCHSRSSERQIACLIARPLVVWFCQVFGLESLRFRGKKILQLALDHLNICPPRICHCGLHYPNVDSVRRLLAFD